jgi:trk system potassium uptake protein TrkA
MNILLAGQGAMLPSLVQGFVEQRHRVTVLNPDASECDQLAQLSRGHIILGQPTNVDTLRTARIDEMDALLCIMHPDHVAFVVCWIASRYFGVPRTLAIISDTGSDRLFQELRLPSFCPTPLIASLIQERTATEAIRSLVPLADGHVYASEISIPGDAPVVGKSLNDVALNENALIACIVRDGVTVIPRGNTIVHPHDAVTIISEPKHHHDVVNSLLGAHS